MVSFNDTEEEIFHLTVEWLTKKYQLSLISCSHTKGKYLQKSNCLATSSYKDDGIFFLIYLSTIIFFTVKESLGKWLSIGWLSIWFFIQFICHEWYTIFNDGFMGNLQNKIEYFAGTMQWIMIDGKYIPDIYHSIILNLRKLHKMKKQ